LARSTPADCCSAQVVGILEVGLGRDAALTQLRGACRDARGRRIAGDVSRGAPGDAGRRRQNSSGNRNSKAANIFLGIGLAMCTDGCGDDQSIVQHLRDIADNMEAGNDDEIPAPPKRH
jgi:hypothetical protein